MQKLRLVSMVVLLLAVPAYIYAAPVSGRIFLDINANGLFDEGEPPAVDVPVTDGLTFVFTDAAGSFTIDPAQDPVLAAGGTAIVAITCPTGHKPTTPWFVPVNQIPPGQTVMFAIAPDSQTLPFSFIHATDCHVPRYGKDKFINFRRDVEQLKDNLDFCIITGDLVSAADSHSFNQASQEYEFFTEQTKDFPIPLYCTPGNHDIAGVRTPIGWDRSSPMHGYGFFTNNIGPLRWSFNYAGIHFVGLDFNRIVNKSYAEGVPQSALDWLEQDLGLVDPDTRVFVFVHSSRRNPELAAILQRNNVEKVFIGHFHRDKTYLEENIPTTISGSVAHIMYDEDRQPGYRVVTVTETGHDTMYRTTGQSGAITIDYPRANDTLTPDDNIRGAFLDPEGSATSLTVKVGDRKQSIGFQRGPLFCTFDASVNMDTDDGDLPLTVTISQNDRTTATLDKSLKVTQSAPLPAPVTGDATSEPTPKASTPPSQGALDVMVENAMNLAITVPLPEAIEPIVCLAKVSATSDVAQLLLLADFYGEKATEQYRWSSSEEKLGLSRQRKAASMLIGRLNRIIDERKGEQTRGIEALETSTTNSFYGRFFVERTSEAYPEEYGWANYKSYLLQDQFEDIEGDTPPGAIVTVTPPIYGTGDANDVQALIISATVDADETENEEIYTLTMTELNYMIGAYNIVKGTSTGINRAVLNPFGSPPAGLYKDWHGGFDIRFEGMFTNDLFDSTAPILFFTTVFGSRDPWAASTSSTGNPPGEALIGAEHPMIVPLIGDAVRAKLPKIMGAHVLSYDADGKLLTFLENTTLEKNADIAMVRYDDGTYSIVPTQDIAIKGKVVISPMGYTGNPEEGVYTFTDASLLIETNNHIILAGIVQSPRLDTNEGSFFADITISTLEGSKVLSEINYSSTGPRKFQIAMGSAVHNIVAASNGFTEDATLPWPEIFHLGIVGEGEPPCILKSDLNNDGKVDAIDLSIMAAEWLKSCD